VNATSLAASRPAVPWLAIGLLLAAVIGLQVLRDRVSPPVPEAPPILWVQSPELARRMALAFDDIAADLYWIRSVVLYGGERRAAGQPVVGNPAERLSLLYPLLDMTTTLDPNFDVAARLGAIFLSEGVPGVKGRPDLGLALLEKGQRHAPERWQYAHDIGFVHYWWLRDYPAAARYFEQASRMPGAPNWLRTLAGTTLLVGGDRDAARTLWSELRDTADVDWLRRTAEVRLLQLRALDEIDRLSGPVAQAALRLGRAPATWAEVVTAGGLPGIPVDPAGVPYALGPDGRIALGDASPLSPLPMIGAH
jgi:hypothetical protein